MGKLAAEKKRERSKKKQTLLAAVSQVYALIVVTGLGK